MTIVQVPVNLGGTNVPYSDDTGPFGMKSNGSYGYVQYLHPMLSEVIAACQLAVTAGNTAVNAPGSAGTSTTSLAIDVTNKVFTTQTGKNWQIGQPVMMASTASPTNWMAGPIVAYNSGTGAMTVAVSRVSGAGTFAAWTISLTGPVLPDVPQTQCRLVKSGANLVLLPCDGNQLWVDGVNRTIPDAGVSLAPTGLTVGINYYIYALMSGGAVALVASSTGPTRDPASGMMVITGITPRRTLVGRARIIAGPAFQDTDTQRFVISFFNRRLVSGETTPVTVTGLTTTSAERTTANRAEFLTWGDEAVTAYSYGNMADTAGGAGLNVFAGQGFDGTIAANEVAVVIPVADAGKPHAYCIPKTAILSEGYHYSSTHGRTSTGSTGAITATNQILIRG